MKLSRKGAKALREPGKKRKYTISDPGEMAYSITEQQSSSDLLSVSTAEEWAPTPARSAIL